MWIEARRGSAPRPPRLGVVGFVVLLRCKAPGAEVDSVERDAEEICGDEAELGGAHADDADDGAVDGADDPALPELLAEQDGAENRQNARDVIQPNSLEYVSHVVFKGLRRTQKGAPGQASDFRFFLPRACSPTLSVLLDSGLR